MSNINTTETTETTTVAPAEATEKKARKPKKDKEAPVKYPFQSKREIVEAIDSDDKAAVAALVQIHTLNAAMCSQKKLVSDLATRALELGDGASQDPELVQSCRAIARRYGRRLALQARAVALAAQPELASLAQRFSANVPAN